MTSKTNGVRTDLNDEENKSAHGSGFTRGFLGFRFIEDYDV